MPICSQSGRSRPEGLTSGDHADQAAPGYPASRNGWNRPLSPRLLPQFLRPTGAFNSAWLTASAADEELPPSAVLVAPPAGPFRYFGTVGLAASGEVGAYRFRAVCDARNIFATRISPRHGDDRQPTVIAFLRREAGPGFIDTVRVDAR